MTDTFFISLAYLKANTPINNNVDNETIRPFIALCMDKYILNICGTNLYNRLITDVQSNSLSGNYLTLMNSYVQPTLAQYSLYEAIPFIGFSLTNKSVLKKSSDSSEPADRDDLIYLTAKVFDNANYFSQRMINYLRANYTLFPELTNNNSDASTIFPSNAEYFSGIQIPNLPLDERFRRSRNGDDCDTNFYNYY